MALTIEPTFASAGPVFRLDGEPAPLLGRDIVSLSITEATDGLRNLELTLHGGSPDPARPGDAARHLDRSTVDFGQQVEVFLGTDDTQRLVFDGVVSALEVRHEDRSPPMIGVCAEDALMSLRMTRRMMTYIDMTDAEMAESIAAQHGLSSDATAVGPRYDVVQQWNQSDLAFLRERARLIQAELWCSDRTLHFAGRDERDGGELTLVRNSQLLDIEIGADLAHQRGSVALSGYDAQSQAVIEETAGQDEVVAEAPGGVTGVELVQVAIGPTVSRRAREGALTATEARSYAQAEILRRGRCFVTACGTTRGSPSMTVGTRLTLQQVGPIFEGEDYYVTRVNHLFDLANGFRTRFDAERSYINEVN